MEPAITRWRAGAQVIGELLDGGRRHNGIVARGQHQDRLADVRGIIHLAKLHHRLECRIGPGDRRRRDAERRGFLVDRGIARIAHGIGCHRIADEGRGVDQRAVAARHIVAAHAQPAQRPHQHARRQLGGVTRQIDHRRRKYDTIEPAPADMGDAQHHRAAHRMRQRVVGRRTIRQHHLLHEGFDIDLIVRKPADVALARIAQLPRRMPLPAPVDHRHREAALAQLAHHHKILSMHSPRPPKTQTVPLRPPAAASAQKRKFRTVRGLDGATHGVVGNRIGRDGNERHAGTGKGQKNRWAKGY